MLSTIHCSTSGDDSRKLGGTLFWYFHDWKKPIAVQCPTIKKLSIWYSSLINRNSSRAWQPLSRVNVAGLLRRLQVKIENMYLFKILIKKHENVFKNWLCPNFLLLPKKSELPKIWGGCSPLAPPARTPMPSRIYTGPYIDRSQNAGSTEIRYDFWLSLCAGFQLTFRNI